MLWMKALTRNILIFFNRMRILEKLKLQETRIWWDLTTLQKYVDHNMIPRGLKLKKLPTNIYSEQFKEDWNTILSNCSIQLMNLIIKNESEKLKDLAENITIEETKLEEFKDLSTFETEHKKLEDNITKLEDYIMQIKKNTFQRDLFDYSHQQVYDWAKRERSTGLPKSILKKKNNRRPSSQVTCEFQLIGFRFFG